MKKRRGFGVTWNGTDLVKMHILHPDVLHHGCLFINVWSDDAKGRAAVAEHSFQIKKAKANVRPVPFCACVIDSPVGS